MKLLIALRQALFIATIIPVHYSQMASCGSLIRDTETEQTISFFANDIISAAGLTTAATEIQILLDPKINAFVSAGQRITITTGLIQATETPGQLMGVIAHEVAHIAGGHLARLKNALDKANRTAQVSNFLGVALGAISGQANLANAFGAGGSHVATRTLLKFSRIQEQSADLAATRYLDMVKVSSRGMLQFLKKLEDQSLLVQANTVPYQDTHPKTKDRISFVENHLQQSNYRRQTASPASMLLHAKLVAKISGFTNQPSITLAKYSGSADNIPANYARAIAYFKKGEIIKSLNLVKKLIGDEPENPFFYELMGQILFENGRISEARNSYQKALELLPNAPLIMIKLAHSMLELPDPLLLGTIKKLVTEAIQKDPKNHLAWHLLGTAYDRAGEPGLAALASAEYNLLLRRKTTARLMAQRAIRLLDITQPGSKRAFDILLATKGVSKSRSR
ncbi:MAG: M48 family metalloprotease [Pseudomonadota bacterium]|nr:M48 family metalloprotease [Pseudomonadota bacterium]MEC9077778.1 M48 family metalloprotease [Pseudomonadota bacterium]